MISISSFDPVDIDQIVEIENVSFKAPWSRDSFLQLSGWSDFSFLVAKDDGKVVGYAIYHGLKEEFDLHNLAVHPDFRKKGIGSALMKKVIDDAQKNDTLEIYLQVRESNDEAKKLYSKFGFKVIGKRARYYSDNQEAAFIMKRGL